MSDAAPAISKQDPFTSEERRRADYVGYLRVVRCGVLRGAMTAPGSNTSLIVEARPVEFAPGDVRYAIVGRFGDTPEQADLKAEARK